MASASSQINSELTPGVVVGGGLLAGGVAAAVAATASGGGADVIVGLAVATWLATALLGAASAWVGTSLLLGWAAMGAAPLALAELVVLSEVREVMPAVLAPVLQGVGLVVISAGTTFDLARSVSRHRNDTLGREMLRQRLEDTRRMAAEDRNHDLGNALMAMEGATLTLVRRRDELPLDQQTLLAEAVAREAARVRRLTAAEADGRATIRVDLREVVDEPGAGQRRRRAGLGDDARPGRGRRGRGESSWRTSSPTTEVPSSSWCCLRPRWTHQPDASMAVASSLSRLRTSVPRLPAMVVAGPWAGMVTHGVPSTGRSVVREALAITRSTSEVVSSTSTVAPSRSSSRRSRSVRRRGSTRSAMRGGGVVDDGMTAFQHSAATATSTEWRKAPWPRPGGDRRRP